MAAPKKPKIRKQQIGPMTVGEFKAKLEGIEMFQEDDWCPTLEQWNLIREMISNLKETEIIQQPVTQPTMFFHQPFEQTPRVATNQRQLSDVTNGTVSSGFENVPLPQNLDVVPSGKPMIKTQTLLGDPNKDGYSTPFA